MKNKNQLILIISLVASGLALVGCGQAEDKSAAEKSAPAGDKKVAAKPYPIKTCLVSGEKLGSMGEPVVMVYEGQEIKFCCKNCKPDFEKEPAKYLAKMPK